MSDHRILPILHDSIDLARQSSLQLYDNFESCDTESASEVDEDIVPRVCFGAVRRSYAMLASLIRSAYYGNNFFFRRGRDRSIRAGGSRRFRRYSKGQAPKLRQIRWSNQTALDSPIVRPRHGTDIGIIGQLFSISTSEGAKKERL